MNQKFFTFIKPYLSAIDSGQIYRQPFGSLYGLLAILNLCYPFYVLYQAYQYRFFSGDFMPIVVFLIYWLVVLLVGWIGFQLLWDRKSKLNISTTSKDDFVATPIFAHFIQTFGEWIGTWMAVIGVGFGLLMMFFWGIDSLFGVEWDDGRSAILVIGGSRGSVIPLYVFLMPIFGYIFLVGSKVSAEMINALAAIANNTKK